MDCLLRYLNCQIFSNMRDAEDKLSSFGYLWHSFSTLEPKSMITFFSTPASNP